MPKKAKEQKETANIDNADLSIEKKCEETRNEFEAKT